MSQFNWPLMHNNILKEDRDALIAFLQNDEILTQSRQVEAFEREWSQWLGVKYSVFVNSGASANLVTMKALELLYGAGEVIVPTITWVSDIASVIQAGHTPVFVDVNKRTLGADLGEILRAITSRTRAVFITHLLGLNALTDGLIAELRVRKIALIEDCCEAHGASFGDQKLGTFGLASNFSFYYAHHMTTIEGGMVSTDNYALYDIVRILRSHGLLRESRDENRKQLLTELFPSLRSDFIFVYPAYNLRSTELNAVVGRNQLKRLDGNNERRRQHFKLFLDNLDPKKYETDFELEGSVNYALILVLKLGGPVLAKQVEQSLHEMGVEFRVGLSGGGNQLRQPYLISYFREHELQERYPVSEYLHFNSWYIGNYPELEGDKIIRLCNTLNRL